MEEQTPDVNPIDPSPIDQDVNTEDSSTPDQDVNSEDSSTEQQEAPQTEEMVPYKRLQEVVKDSHYWKDKAMEFAEKATTAVQQPLQQQPRQDPYAGMDAETERWHRANDARVSNMIDSKAKQLSEPLLRQNEILMNKIATIEEKEFRKTNKDVQPNSQEESEIIRKINLGYSPEDAAWSVMGPKRVQSAGVTTKVVKQHKKEVKAQANLETSTIPQASGLLPHEGSDNFRELLDKEMRDNGM